MKLTVKRLKSLLREAYTQETERLSNGFIAALRSGDSSVVPVFTDLLIETYSDGSLEKPYQMLVAIVLADVFHVKVGSTWRSHNTLDIEQSQPVSRSDPRSFKERINEALQMIGGNAPDGFLGVDPNYHFSWGVVELDWRSEYHARLYVYVEPSKAQE